jgi:outer membrane protein insertion porin family
VDQITFPGGDASLVGNLEYRYTIAGPVALVPFIDMGIDPILRRSQLRINDSQLGVVNTTAFGCPAQDPVSFVCLGTQTPGGPNSSIPLFNRNLQVLSSTNWTPRVSTGIELQMFLPVVNAPFRIYYAYNPVRLDQNAGSPVAITRSMFPVGAAGDYTYQLTKNTYSPRYQLREPRKTFRFTVATTF